MQIAPTSYVRRRAGLVSEARLNWSKSGILPNGAQRGRSVAQNVGLRFEKRVSEALAGRYEYFLPQVVFNFVGDYARETCILDGVLFAHPLLVKRSLVLVEIKKRHTADAWFQLRYLYSPVVQRAFPNFSVRLLEICKEFEPGVKLPEPYKLHKSFEDFLSNGANFGVISWR